MQDLVVRPPLSLRVDLGERGIQRIRLGWCGGQQQEDAVLRSRYSLELDRYLHSLLLSVRPQPPSLFLDWGRVSGFACRVLTELENRVGPGEWISYSRLAELCGVPGGARAVGRVMSGNPWPLLVPCHRVLRKDKGLGGFSSGLELKSYLLRLEKVELAQV